MQDPEFEILQVPSIVEGRVSLDAKTRPLILFKLYGGVYASKYPLNYTLKHLLRLKTLSRQKFIFFYADDFFKCVLWIERSRSIFANPEGVSQSDLSALRSYMWQLHAAHFDALCVLSTAGEGYGRSFSVTEGKGSISKGESVRRHSLVEHKIKLVYSRNLNFDIVERLFPEADSEEDDAFLQTQHELWDARTLVLVGAHPWGLLTSSALGSSRCKVVPLWVLFYDVLYVAAAQSSDVCNSLLRRKALFSDSRLLAHAYDGLTGTVLLQFVFSSPVVRDSAENCRPSGSDEDCILRDGGEEVWQETEASGGECPGEGKFSLLEAEWGECGPVGLAFGPSEYSSQILRRQPLLVFNLHRYFEFLRDYVQRDGQYKKHKSAMHGALANAKKISTCSIAGIGTFIVPCLALLLNMDKALFEMLMRQETPHFLNRGSPTTFFLGTKQFQERFFWTLCDGSASENAFLQRISAVYNWKEVQASVLAAYAPRALLTPRVVVAPTRPLAASAAREHLSFLRGALVLRLVPRNSTLLGECCDQSLGVLADEQVPANSDHHVLCTALHTLHSQEPGADPAGGNDDDDDDYSLCIITSQVEQFQHAYDKFSRAAPEHAASSLADEFIGALIFKYHQVGIRSLPCLKKEASRREKALSPFLVVDVVRITVGVRVIHTLRCVLI